MPIAVRVGTTIRRARREVACVLFDPRYDAEWMKTLQEPEFDGRGPLDVGRRLDRALRVPLGWIELSLEVREFAHDKRAAMRAETPIRATVTFEIDGIPEGALVWLGIEAEPGGWRRAATPWVKLAWKRSLLGDLARLKSFIESNEHREVAAGASLGRR